jgi:hypothetical protein
MGQRKKIDRAGEQFRVAVERAVATGMTVDEIHAHLDTLGLKIARSSVGEYVKGTREAAAEMRRITAAAEAMKLDLGDMQKAPMGQLLIQATTALMTRTIMPLVGSQDEDEAPNFKEIYQIARAVKSLADAGKVDFDLASKIEAEANRRAAAAAATVAEKVMRENGMSADVAAIIFKEMGIPYEPKVTTA